MIKGKQGIAFFTAFGLLLSTFMGFTVKADEKQESNTLTVHCGENGNYQVAGMENNDSNQNVMNKGQQVEIQFTANAGYRLAGVAFEKTELANDNGQVTFTMPDGDINLSATFEADNEPQMLTQGDNSITVMDMMDDYDKLGPVGSQAHVGALPGYENAPMQVVRYQGSDFEILDTWDEGVIGVDGGMWTFCTEPLNTFRSGTATVYDAVQFYTQEEVTKMALVIKFCQENQNGLSQSQKYYITQCAVWTLQQKLNGYYDGDVSFECNGFVDSGIMGGMIEAALNYARDNADKYKGYGKVLWNGVDQKVSVFKVDALEGQIEVYKKSNNPELTENNPCYSLAGAEFTVYMPGTNDVVAKIVTDSAGHGIVTAPTGTYDILETKAPKGFALKKNGKRDTIIVNPSATATYKMVDEAQNDPATILLGKVDAETNTNKPEGSLPLINAEFTVKYYKGFYDTDPASQGKGAERTWVLRTDSDGFANLADEYKVGGDEFYRLGGIITLPLGTITIQETKPPVGYLINNEVFVREIVSNNNSGATVDTYNKPTISETVIRGGISVKKLDDETNSGVPQGNASLAGAKIQIISDNDSPVKVNGTIYQKGQIVALLTTNDKGEAQTAADVLPYGEYLLKEQSPPNGYQMVGVIQQRFSIRENGVLVQMTTPDTAIKDNIIRGGVKIQKWDSETNQGKPQGNATLKGAEFELSSLNANPVMVEGKKFERNQVIVTFETDAQGFVQTPGNYLPYGKYKFKETKPPEGYNHTGTLEREFEIRDNGAIVQLTTSSGAIKNEVIRGDLQLVKFRESQDQDQDQKVPLEGIKFTITSKTTGEKHVITTDKYGYASTKQLGISDRGNLVYDTYIVQESNTPHGLKPVKDFEITIKNEGETLYYILEDKLVLSPAKLLKVDKTTGKRIPLADTEFQLLDKDKNPVIMKTHYPSETIHYTYKTDAGGSLTLPDKLPVGVYYWREINSPQGYLLNGQDLKFEITRGHDWEEPFIVEFENMPAMGKIAIKKTDKETKDPLAGAVFEVKAKEDIVTPDQTVRAKKGETVDTITTQKNGTAETKKLYLGKYQVQETKPSPGYALSTKKHDVELKYKDQSQEIVTAGLDVTNAPTKIIIEKVDGKTKKPLSGAAFEVWNKAENPDSVDSEMAVKQRYVTDGKGSIELARLLPGTYCLQEAEPPIGYAGDQKLHEFTIDKDGMVKGKSTFTMQIENDKSQIIGTKAADRDTGKGQAIAKEKTVLADEVSYQNLVPGQEYTLKGILMDKSTGKPLLSKGKEIRAEKTFKPLKAEGIEKVEYSFDSRDLAGKEAVVFEELYTKGTLISAHEDSNDLGQTVKFPKHEIRTKAQDKDTKTGQAIAQEKTVIVDRVTYKGLIPGEEYTLKGILMDKSNGKPLLSEGKEVRAQKTFKHQKPEGIQEIEFTFDSRELNNKEAVAFEILYAQKTVVAAHQDIRDAAQTVKLSPIRPVVSVHNTNAPGPVVKTGDENASFCTLMVLLAVSGGAAALSIHKKKHIRGGRQD